MSRKLVTVVRIGQDNKQVVIAEENNRLYAGRGSLARQASKHLPKLSLKNGEIYQEAAWGRKERVSEYDLSAILRKALGIK